MVLISPLFPLQLPEPQNGHLGVDLSTSTASPRILGKPNFASEVWLNLVMFSCGQPSMENLLLLDGLYSVGIDHAKV